MTPDGRAPDSVRRPSGYTRQPSARRLTISSGANSSLGAPAGRADPGAGRLPSRCVECLHRLRDRLFVRVCGRSERHEYGVAPGVQGAGELSAPLLAMRFGAQQRPRFGRRSASSTAAWAPGTLTPTTACGRRPRSRRKRKEETGSRRRRRWRLVNLTGAGWKRSAGQGSARRHDADSLGLAPGRSRLRATDAASGWRYATHDCGQVGHARRYRGRQ